MWSMGFKMCLYTKIKFTLNMDILKYSNNNIIESNIFTLKATSADFV